MFKHQVQELIRNFNPDTLVLKEKKVHSKKPEILLEVLMVIIEVPPDGLSRGLRVLWKIQLISILILSSLVIDLFMLN